jgi:hypothetical protein
MYIFKFREATKYLYSNTMTCSAVHIQLSQSFCFGGDHTLQRCTRYCSGTLMDPKKKSQIIRLRELPATRKSQSYLLVYKYMLEYMCEFVDDMQYCKHNRIRSIIPTRIRKTRTGRVGASTPSNPEVTVSDLGLIESPKWKSLT